MSKSLEKELEQKTIDFDFPRYSSFQECCELTDDLYKYLIENGIKNIEDAKKDSLFLSPNSAYLNSKIDANLYSTFTSLALSFFYVQGLYERNGIPVDKFTLEKQDDFVELMPDTDCLYMANVWTETELEGLSKGFVIPILEGIGDKMYQLNRFNPRQTNSSVENFMKNEIHDLANYARIGMRASKIIKGFGLPFEANSLLDVSENLTDEEQMFHSLKKDNFYNYFNNFLKLNAQFHNLIMHEGFAHDFVDLLGREITETMNFAKMAHFNNHVLENLALSPIKKIVMPYHKKIYYPEKLSRKKLKDNLENNKGYAIAELNERSVRDSEEEMNFSKSFLLDIESRLVALDVPLEIANNMKSYLRLNRGAHKVTTSTSRMKKEKVFEVLLEEKRKQDVYPQALSRLATLTTGKNPAPISYQFFEDSWVDACGISTIVYVTKPNKKYADGIEVIEEGESKFDVIAEIATTSKKYPDADILVKPNAGACFILETNALGAVFNPSPSMIDVREAYSNIRSKDEFMHKIANLRIDIHEMIHGSEVDKKLPWRNAVTGIAKYFSNFALTDLERLNVEYTGRSLKKLFSKEGYKRTWGDAILDILDEFSLVALGQGKAARIFRKYGSEIGALKVGINKVGENEEHEINKIRELLLPDLENSKTAKLYLDCRDALVKRDEKLLEKIVVRANNLGAELSSICETMTEAYAYMACQDFIENGCGGGLNRQEKDYYSQSLYDELLIDGIHAKKFFSIIKKSPKKPDNELLAKSGMKYQRIIGSEDLNKAKSNLIEIGYNPLNPYEAYEDIETLREESEIYGIPFEDLLKPMNSSTALIGLRYSSRIPTIFDYRVKYGKKQGFERLLNAESWKEIENDLK